MNETLTSIESPRGARRALGQGFRQSANQSFRPTPIHCAASPAAQTQSFHPPTSLRSSEDLDGAMKSSKVRGRQSGTTPPLHTRPLYPTIPLPEIEGAALFDMNDTQSYGRGARTQPHMQEGTMGPRMSFGARPGGSHVTSGREAGAGGSPAENACNLRMQSMSRGLQTPVADVPYAQPNPIINVVDMYAAQTSAGGSIGIGWTAPLHAPATMPPTRHITFAVRSKLINVMGTGTRGAIKADDVFVTVGNVLDALVWVFSDLLGGCEHCAGVCRCDSRMGELISELEIWKEGQ